MAASTYIVQPGSLREDDFVNLGIPFTKTLEGWLISRDGLELLCRRRGVGIACQEESRYHHKTRIVRLVRPLVDEGDQGAAKVQMRFFDGLRGATFEGLVRQVLGPYVKRSILIRRPNEIHLLPLALFRRSFVVWPAASPISVAAFREHRADGLPRLLMGNTVGRHDAAHRAPARHGLGDELAVAALVGNHAFLLHDYRVGQTPEDWYRIHEYSLSLVRDALAGVERERMVRNLTEASRKRYVRLCSQTMQERWEEESEQREVLEHRARALQAELTKVLRSIGHLKGAPSKAADEFARDYDLIGRIKGVRSVALTDDGRITVRTEMLYCRNSRTKKLHELGKFVITIDTRLNRATTHFGITFENLTRQPDGHHAPHVSGAGTACFGTLMEVVPELLARQQYPVLVEMCLKFLQQANMNDQWGKFLTLFPVVDEE